MPTPNNMPRISAEEREFRAMCAKNRRESEIDAKVALLPKVTETKAYRKALAKAGLK
jgi:hypothetical protein